MIVKISPHSGQFHIIDNRARFNTVCCGRRFGKTFLAYTLLTESVSRKQVSAYLCPTAEDYAKRWDEASEFFRPILAPGGLKISEGVMRFTNRAEIHWYGLHRYDGIRGNKYHRAIIDEAAHAPKLQDAWSMAIRPTLTDYKGDAYFLSTPFGDNYFKELSTNADKRTTWKHFHAPTSANPYIDKAEIEEARLDMSTEYFRQEYLAEFISLQGARIRREWLKFGDVPEGATYAMGVDLAISTKTDADFSSIVVTAKQGDNYYVVDVIRLRATFNEMQEAIKRIASRYLPFAIQIEATQYQAATVQELIRTTTLPVRAVYPHKDKVMRFGAIEGKYEHGYVIHSRSLPREFEDELLTFPHGAHDDTIDALVYSITAHTQKSFAFTV